MRDYLILAVILGSAPICLFSPYFGVLMWSWIAYFNPHRLGWGLANNFPVASVIAVPTIIGTLFARGLNRRFMTRETFLLLFFWVWVVFSFFVSTQVLVLSDHVADGKARLIIVSKILLMTCLTILVVNSKKKLKYLFMVTAFSISFYGIKGALFGVRTQGEFRVWGPADSFIADNNDFALALNMTIPMLFFLARDEEDFRLRWILRVAFFASVLSVLLTYSRGGLLGLGIVLAAIALKSRYKLFSVAMIGLCVILVLSFAPGRWTERMDSFFVQQRLDTSAQQRITSWGFAWNLAKAFPVTGGGFECFTPALFQRYSSRDPQTWFSGGLSSGPHSIYFQVLGEQGFAGLAIFLGLLACCWRSARRLHRHAARSPSLQWISNYAQILEVSLYGFMVSGAFLGRAYFDLYFQLVACLIVLRILHDSEVAQVAAVEEEHAEFVEQPQELLT